MHTTYYNSRGIEVPSVTTILKVVNKPELLGWANFMGFKRIKVEDVQDKTAYFGTCIHDWLYARLMGSEYIQLYSSYCEKEDFEATVKNFERSIMAFHKLEPITMEESFVVDDFAGTIDYLGYIDGKKALIDFKTSKAVYTTHKLQLGGYYHLLKAAGHDDIEICGILNINVKGAKITYFSKEQLEKFEKIFLALVQFYILYKGV